MMWLTTMNPDRAGSSASCRRTSSARRRCLTCSWATICRPQGAHCRVRQSVSRFWPIFPEKNLRKGTVTLCREKSTGNAGKPSNPNVVGLKAEVISQPITETLEQNYMPYAMSVIVSRAIPEIDGFKPSHRKLLYDVQDESAHGRAHEVGQHRRRDHASQPARRRRDLRDHGPSRGLRRC